MSRRKISGLNLQARPEAELPEGAYLVKVVKAQHAYTNRKPVLKLTFQVIEPLDCSGRSLGARLYCTPKALWKLAWFLKDFGYSAELIDDDQIDEQELIGAEGAVRISYTTLSGTRYLNLDAFAPAPSWERTVVPKAA